MPVINQLHSILSDIPVNIDTAHARIKFKRLIRQLEQEQQPQTKALPYPKLKLIKDEH